MDNRKYNYLRTRPDNYRGFDICLTCQEWQGKYPGAGKCNLTGRSQIYCHDCSESSFSIDPICLGFVTLEQIQATNKKRILKQGGKPGGQVRDNLCLYCRGWLHSDGFTGRCCHAEGNTKFYSDCKTIRREFNNFEPNEFGKEMIAILNARNYSSLYKQILRAADTYASR